MVGARSSGRWAGRGPRSPCATAGSAPPGRTQTKDLGSADAAAAHVDKLVAEKVGKGYRETGAAGGAAPVPAPEPGAGRPPVVAETGGVPALPDETTFVLPTAWARKAEPFRGLRPAAPPAVDAAQTRIAARALWQAAESEITAVLEGPRADPELVRHATRHRSGRQADPLGAAALVAVLATRAALRSHLVRDCATLADDLVLAHGIPFAAETAVHLADVAVVPHEHPAPGPSGG